MLRLPLALVDPSDAARFVRFTEFCVNCMFALRMLQRLGQRRRLQRRVLQRAAAAELHRVGVLDRPGGVNVERNVAAAAHAFDCADAVGLGDVQQLIHFAVDGLQGRIDIGRIAGVLRDRHLHRQAWSRPKSR